MKLFENEDLNSKLFEELVPSNGAAGNLAGEMVRAYNRIGQRWVNDGDRINVEYGKETCNAPARFLMKYLPDGSLVDTLRELWNDMLPDKVYEQKLFDFCNGMTLYINAHPELREEPAPDMFSFFDPDEDEEEYEEE